MEEIFKKEQFDQKVRLLASGFQKRYGDLLKYDPEEEIKKFDEYRQRLRPFVCDAVPTINDAQSKNIPILVEGANALLLDLDFGTYPFVTSSNTGLGGIFTGLAINPTKIANIVGVVKAYTTRVGGGPFPTESTGEIGTKLQEIGREFGVTTGRRRRCGWLDLVVVKYSNDINHYTALNLTKLDILDTFETIKIATAYKYPAGHPEAGTKLESFPADLDVLADVDIEYHEMPGWNKPTTGAKTYYDLPAKARDYIEYIEKFIGVPIKWIGTGPSRDSMIMR